MPYNVGIIFIIKLHFLLFKICLFLIVYSLTLMSYNLAFGFKEFATHEPANHIPEQMTETEKDISLNPGNYQTNRQKYYEHS